ncbi:FecCD family ABC transporter permease [Paenibacillus sp. y28]|uniref:FecCD family ABC transporter permease n=1 Tax=Paenibacillus sp. y28 TaxID=3129110 RepID=UPI003016AE08
MSNYRTFRTRGQSFSILWNKKHVTILSVLFMLLCAVFIVSTGIGTMKISPLDVVRVLIGRGEDTYQVVITQFRLPRMLVAVMVGAALAVSGALLQGIIRNPLASPDLVGITGGASVAAVSFIIFWGGTLSIHLLPLAAISGALLSAMLMYGLAWKKGVSPLRMVLIGIGISSACSALSSVLLLAGPVQQAGQALSWLTGSVYGSSWKQVWLLLPWMLVLLPLTLLLTRDLNAQSLGDDIASSIGGRVQRQRLVLLALSVALAGAAAAIGGAISFVGLMASHMARKLVGPSFGALLPTSAVIGALTVLLADVVARTAFAPLDLPAGIFTAAIGAPFFVYLLYRSGRN